MPFQKSWLLKDQVCLVILTDTISLDDIKTISLQHEEWVMQNAPIPAVHYIVDTTQVVSYPKNIRSIKTHLAGRHTHTGWILVITDDFFIKHIGHVFAKLLGFRLKVVKSFADGYRHLQALENIPASPDMTISSQY